MENNKNLFERLLPIFLIILVTIVVIFIAQIVLDVKTEVKEVKATLEKMEIEKIKSASFQPFKILDENCTSCHSDRKFMGLHGSDNELTNIVKFMQKMPGAHLSDVDVDKIHGSLSLLKCVRCHDEQQINALGSMSLAKQKEVLQRMAKKSLGDILPEELDQIQKTLLKVQGF